MLNRYVQGTEYYRVGWGGLRWRRCDAMCCWLDKGLSLNSALLFEASCQAARGVDSDLFLFHWPCVVLPELSNM
jgi:hypothetical protein